MRTDFMVRLYRNIFLLKRGSYPSYLLTYILLDSVFSVRPIGKVPLNYPTRRNI